MISTPSTKALSGFSQLLNLFGGGGIKKASIFSAGISPYITSQIIIQILSNELIKKFNDLRKMGELGRMKLEFYTRLLTFPFSVLTSLGTLYLLNNEGVSYIHLWEPPVKGRFTRISDEHIPSPQSQFVTFNQLYITQRVLMVLTFVSGTYISLFLADLITKKGLGNGISLLIVSGIISSLPENFYDSYSYFSRFEGGLEDLRLLVNIFKFAIYIFFYFVIISLMVYIAGSVRKLPIQQTGAGLILDREQLGYLPIKLMPVGIMPVIFAGSIMIFPVGIAELLKTSSPAFNSFIQNYIALNSVGGLSIYFCLIVLFTFLYTQIQLNVEEMCRNFQKFSQFIPGIMIGQETYNYLKMVLNKINWLGAPFLGFVTIMPNLMNILTGMPSHIALGGTGAILLVSTSLNIYEELLSTHIISRYKFERELELTNLEERLQGTEISTSNYLIW